VAGDAQGAAFVGGGDEAEQQLRAGVVQRREPDFVNLCGYPHSWIYADTATMPSRPLNSFGLLDAVGIRGWRSC
jgi:hypothetical protein